MLHAFRALLSLALLAGATLAQNRPDPDLPVARWQGRDVVAGELLVQFRANTNAPQQALAHAQVGAVARGALTPRLTRVTLPAGADLETLRARYAARADVEFAQPNVLHRAVGVPDDLYWPLQWGLPQVRADVAWDAFAGNASGVVAIIDTGVDVDHPDLAAQLAWGYDTYAGDSDPDDVAGHGTHCAGIAAAVTGNAQGVAGVAPGCRFAAYRCGNTSFPSSALVPAIEDAVARGALVISMSWGSDFDDLAVRNALQDAYDAGCVLVAAAGNDATSDPFYPAAHPFVLAVGASSSTDARATFSNWGSWVDLAAPGQAIYSTWIGGQYKYLAGTSMACPLVGGAAALLYSRLGERTPAHAAQVRAALEQSAVPVGSWVAHGRLDVAAAMETLFPDGPPEVLGINPAQVPALHGTTVTLSGNGLASATAVTVAGQAVPFTVVDPATISFSTPDATGFGPATVVVSTLAGTASSSFTWVQTVPPQLRVPATVTAGDSISWAAGGPPGDLWYLLLALQPDTFAHGGEQILVPTIILGVGTLDGLGLDELAAVVPAGAAGVSFSSQLVTWDATVTGASPIETTIIE